MKEQVIRKTVLTASVEVTGVVTFTDGPHVEITVGQPPKPEAKVYCDGNPLNLMTGEKVLVNLR